MKDRLERHIENKVGKILLFWAHEQGISLEYLKFEVPGVRGYPDRLILWGKGNMMFVEFKRPKLRPTNLQQFRHERLNAMGFEVHTYDNIRIAVANITEKILSTARATPGDQVDPGGQRSPTVPASGEGENSHDAQSVPDTSAVWLRRRIVGTRTFASCHHLMAQ